jgi:hypothetical protein
VSQHCDLQHHDSIQKVLHVQSFCAELYAVILVVCIHQPLPHDLEGTCAVCPHDGIMDVCPAINTCRPYSLTYHVYLLDPHPHCSEEMHVPFMAFIIVIPAWVYAVFMSVHMNCSQTSCVNPIGNLFSHMQQFPSMHRLLLHAPRSYIGCSYMSMGRCIMGFVNGN